MGADASDPGKPSLLNPLLSEAVDFAAQMYEGRKTDLIAPK